MPTRRPLFETFECRRLMSGTIATHAAPSVAHASATYAPLAASSSGVADVGSLIYDAIHDANVPAGAGGVIRDGALASIGASGKRISGKKYKVTVDDRFHLGSSGKAMTSTMVARLIERGTLDWDTTVLDLWPKLKGKITSSFGDVTVWQLMTNRSGIDDSQVTGKTLIKLGTLDGGRMEQRAAMVPILLTTKANGSPGANFEYSNWGYTLLGAMAERATGEAFENLMRKHVFKPLKMDTANFGPQGSDVKTPSQPRGHDSSGKARTASNDDLLPYLAPAGTMSMSVGDWSRFLKAHMGLKVSGTQLLKSSTLDRLHTPYDASGTQYAAGWVVTDVAGVRVLSHDGTNGNWYSTVQLIPSLKYAAFSVVNEGGSSGMTAAYAIKSDLIGDTNPLLAGIFG